MNKNKILYLTIVFLLFSFNKKLFAQDIDQDKITQLQIKSLQHQIKYDLNQEVSKKKVAGHVFSDSLKLFDYPFVGDDVDIKTAGELSNFGYSFFNEPGDRLIWNNQPPHQGYILGPGDEIIIELWGDTQLRTVHSIDQYGKINIDKIGQVNVAGTDLAQIESRLLKKFQNVYSSLKGEFPTATMDISIGKLKSVSHLKS